MNSLDTGTLSLLRRARLGLACVTGLAAAFALAACSPKAPPPAADAPAGQVDSARLAAIDKEPGAWLTGGRDAGKTHYSPLDGISRETAPGFLALPNVACVGGSWVVPEDAVKAGDWDRIEALAKDAATLGRT